MPRTLEFFFDYSCPFAYLGSTQVERLAERFSVTDGAPATLVYRPILLGGVFRALGTPQRLFEAQVAPKAAHNVADMKRWAGLYGVPLEMPPHHPMRTVEALRATLATGLDPKVIHGFFHAYWAEGRAISEPEVLRGVLSQAGHDADAILSRIGADDLKDDLRARTEEAIRLGVFGVPVYRVDGGRIVWGQDRMPQVAGLSWDALLGSPQRRMMPGAPTHKVDFYWDFSSPFAYLGYLQAAALAEKTGATLVHRPILLGALFKQVGQPMVPLGTWPAPKQAYYMEDMRASAAALGAPFRFPTRFPTNSLKALRTYLALPSDRRDGFARATFKAYWADDQDISDDGVLDGLVGPDADELRARRESPEVKAALAESTARAVSAGVFGAPTWVVDGSELFWGQDRLVLVERALLA